MRMARQVSSWHLSSHTQLSAFHWGQWPPLCQGRQGHFQGLRGHGSSSSSERILVGKRSEKEAFWGQSLRLSHPAVPELQKPQTQTLGLWDSSCPLGLFLALYPRVKSDYSIPTERFCGILCWGGETLLWQITLAVIKGHAVCCWLRTWICITHLNWILGSQLISLLFCSLYFLICKVGRIIVFTSES